MTATDRICAFLQSKLPQSFWGFHGESIRAFIAKEVEASAPDIKTCEQSMRDYHDGKCGDLDALIAQGQSITNDDFHRRAKVTPAAMQEVIGVVTARVSQSQPVSPLSESPPASDAPAELEWHDGREPPNDRRDVLGEWIDGRCSCWYSQIGEQWYRVLMDSNFPGPASPPIRWRELTDAEKEPTHG